MKTKPFLLCLTGYTGVGKTTVKNAFGMYTGVKTFYTKDLHKIILGEQASSIDKMDVSLQFDDKLDFIKKVMSCVDRYKEDARVVVLDSIRSTDELEYIRTLPEYSGLRLIHVSCDEHLRLKRLQKRDNCNLEVIEKRDRRDTGKDNSGLFNMEDLFDRSDFTINTSNSLASINKQVYFTLQALPKKVSELNRGIVKANKEKQNG